MSWRGEEGGIAAARAGHDVVMAPEQFVYLDYYQAKGPDEPPAIGGFTPIEKVYGYEPIPKSLTPAEAARVLGAQAQLWTEYMPNGRHVEYMAWPRLCALAEVVWSPREARDFQSFEGRLIPHLERLKVLDVNFRPYQPAAGSAAAPASKP
jgi:hexosaminidase